jgi:hypothetical protein
MRTMGMLAATGLLCACTAAAAEPIRSHVVNGGFEDGVAGWGLPPQVARLVEVPGRGQCLELSGAGGAAQEVFLGARRGTLTATVDLKAEGIAAAGEGRGYAYAAVYQYDQRGELVRFFDFVQVTDRCDWSTKSYTFEIAATAETVSLRCGIFNATGQAWFDNWTLVEGTVPRAFAEVQSPAPDTGTPNGVIGIFREEGFPVKGTASSPQVLHDALVAGGIATRFLSAADLANPEVLRPDAVDLVVLPYGGSFPAEARECFVSYLHRGGDFISLGGYAFNHLLRRQGERWLPEAEVVAAQLAAAMAPGRSLLQDGGFERDPAAASEGAGGWRRGGGKLVDESPREGARCLRLAVPAEQAEGMAGWEQHVPAVPGRRYRLRAAVRTRDITGAGFAFAALYQHDAEDKLVTFRDIAQVRGTSEWTEYGFEAMADPRTAVLVVKCGIYRASGTAWFDDFVLADVTGIEAKPMNTASGRPEDGLVVSPAQIGVFDADYRLRRVQSVRAAAGQTIFPQGVAFGPVQGWAASGVRGTDHTRWVPLLDAFDRYGRPRGPAAALMIHYSGFYAGSAWAYFGVEDQDLFAAGNEAMATGLCNLVRAMVRGVYLHGLRCDFAGYPPGGTAKVSVRAANRGAGQQDLEVLVVVQPATGVEALFEAMRRLTLAPRASGELAIEVALPAACAPGLHRVEAVARLEGQEVDRMETGFVVLAPPGSAGEPGLRFADNYLRYGDRPLFLFGCDTYAYTYMSTTEDPLWWAREHAACRDYGFQIYENLQYNNPGHRMADWDWRNFAGMAQLTQQHDLVFMPGLLIGHNVAISDQALAEESRQCREYAERLKDTPRLLWYINGDYQLRHDDKEALRAKWNAFLQQRYGTIEALRAAWEQPLPDVRLGELPFPPANSGRWDDVAQVDLFRFHVQLMTDWNRAHVAAIRSADTVHPITSEYYCYPFSGIDLRLTMDGQDVANTGYFDEPGKDIARLPLRLRWSDLRSQAKSLSLGEYGIKTHPAWRAADGGSNYHIVRTEEEQQRLFMAVAHYGFGMGASKIQNWCLRDAAQNVFPWGVFYPGPLIPKDIAYVHRNLSLLMRTFAPRYEAPALTVLLCDNLRLGNQENLGLDAGYRCFEALLGLHADFTVLSDWFADGIPASTHVLIYPAAICPDDASLESVRQWVERGGTLLITGDFGFAGDRRHSRPERLLQLAGLEWVSTLYPPGLRSQQKPTPLSAPDGGAVPLAGAAPMLAAKAGDARVLAATAAGLPVVTTRTLGKGRVVCCTDPLELGPDVGAVRGLYRWFLAEAGIPLLPLTPDDPELHAFRAPTRDGAAWVLFSQRQAEGDVAATVQTPAGPVSLGLRSRCPAIAGVGADGRVTVLGGAGACSIGPDRVLDGPGLATAIALDGKDLRQSGAVLVLPFSTGELRLGTPARPWTEPVALLGDLSDGRCRVLETLPGAGGSQFILPLDADRATLVALVCEVREQERWQAALDTFIGHPEQVPGY